jgi:hypothetical protein
MRTDATATFTEIDAAQPSAAESKRPATATATGDDYK